MVCHYTPSGIRNHIHKPIRTLSLVQAERETVMKQENDMVMISKWIINASYDLTEVQENILTMVCNHVRQFISTDKGEIRSMIDRLYKDGMHIEFDTNFMKAISKRTDLKGNNAMIEALQEKGCNITYRFKDNEGKILENHCPIFANIQENKTTKHLYGYINPWALPFILYYGQGAGGNIISIQKALTIRGKYSKRLYKLLCGYVSKGIYKLTKEYILNSWKINEKCMINGRCKSYIDKAVNEINSNDVGFKVSYKPILESKGQGRPKVIAYEFIIKSDKETNTNDGNTYRTIYNIMNRIAINSNANIAICDKVFNADKGNKLINKWTYYSEQVSKGAMTDGQRKAAIETILREEYLDYKN